jgi:hypothetical protein
VWGRGGGAGGTGRPTLCKLTCRASKALVSPCVRIVCTATCAGCVRLVVGPYLSIVAACAQVAVCMLGGVVGRPVRRLLCACYGGWWGGLCAGFCGWCRGPGQAAVELLLVYFMFPREACYAQQQQ